MKKAEVSHEKLIKLYQEAVARGNRGAADVAAAALQADLRATVAASEAKALSRLANEM